MQNPSNASAPPTKRTRRTGEGRTAEVCPGAQAWCRRRCPPWLFTLLLTSCLLSSWPALQILRSSGRFQQSYGVPDQWFAWLSVAEAEPIYMLETGWWADLRCHGNSDTSSQSTELLPFATLMVGHVDGRWWARTRWRTGCDSRRGWWLHSCSSSLATRLGSCNVSSPPIYTCTRSQMTSVQSFAWRTWWQSLGHGTGT